MQVSKKRKTKKENKTMTRGVHGAFETLAVSDTTERYEKTNVAKPCDFDVEEARDWVNHNKK